MNSLRSVLSLAITCTYLSAVPVQAMPISFNAWLDQNEATATGSTGTGSALVVFNTSDHTLSFQVNFNA